MGREEPEPVDPSAMRSADVEKQRGAAKARALLIMVVRSIFRVVWGELRGGEAGLWGFGGGGVMA